MSNWVFTSGGPTILCSSKDGEAWNGVDDGHYQTACSVRKYADVIVVANKNYLVFGGEPLQSRFFQIDNMPTLVRWEYGPDERSVDQLLPSLTTCGLQLEEVCTFHVNSNEMILCDAAQPKPSSDRCLCKTNLSTGQKQVKLYFYDDGNETRLWLHQFDER